MRVDVLKRAIVLGLAVLGLGAAQAGTPAQAADKITVGVIPIVDVAPAYLGKAKGIFAKHGLDVELKLAQGGAAFVPSVVSGQYEFGFSNVTTLIVAAARGLDLVAVAAGNYSTGEKGHDFGGIVARGDSPIENAKDLEGKTVAVNNLQNIGDTTVRQAVRLADGDPSKVKFVELAFPDMPAALANNRIEAAWVVEPFLTIMKGQGAKVISWNLAETAPDLMVAAYFTSRKYIDDHQDLVKRFQAAINESLEYADAHPDEARQIVSTYTRIPADVLSKLTLPKWKTKMNRASSDVLADLAVKDGLIAKKPDLTKLIP
jgi:NitT/TauT family transport system substrate-binding protein